MVWDKLKVQLRVTRCLFFITQCNKKLHREKGEDTESHREKTVL